MDAAHLTLVRVWAVRTVTTQAKSFELAEWPRKGVYESEHGCSSGLLASTATTLPLAAVIVALYSIATVIICTLLNRLSTVGVGYVVNALVLQYHHAVRTLYGNGHYRFTA